MASGEVSLKCLSERICEQMGWRDARTGRLQDMSCRKALARLAREGKLRLPKGGDAPSRKKRKMEVTGLREVKCDLKDLGKWELVMVTGADEALSGIWNGLMESYHELGGGPFCGCQMRYLVRSEKYGWLGALGYCGASFRQRSRDEYVGWSEWAREKNLERVVRQSRFLILPGVKVKNLATQILSRSLKGLGDDWEKRYGYHPVLVETFVNPERHAGTCYKAGNWEEIGLTSGRERNGGSGGVSRKKVYVHPLCKDWRQVLCGRGEDEPWPVVERREGYADWAEQEFGEAQFGDDRLTMRLCHIARDFYAQPGASIMEASKDWPSMKAAYNFFKNEKTSMEEILRTHQMETVKRMQSEKVVFVVQDTTTVNYTAHPATEGLGAINTTKDNAVGLIAHDTLAFGESGVPLGVVQLQCWTRDLKETGKRKDRAKRSLEEKESQKWFESYRATVRMKRACPGTEVIAISDRESDIHELFVEAVREPDRPKVIIRADRGRQRKVGQDEVQPLWDMMAKEPVVGSYELMLPRDRERPARIATVQVRHAEVTLVPPKRKKHQPSPKVWAVYALEEQVPTEGERIEWMLLTTEAVESFEKALWVINCYVKRWGIEVFHRILKSGCKIEDRRLESADRLQNCLAVDVVIAWRVHRLTMLGREHADLPCTVYFSDDEWKALYTYTTKDPYPPEEPLRLGDAMRMVGCMGGFPNRSSDGDPGPTFLWRGIVKLAIVTEVLTEIRPYIIPRPKQPSPSKIAKCNNVSRAP
jgi:hypothetical protein